MYKFSFLFPLIFFLSIHILFAQISSNPSFETIFVKNQFPESYKYNIEDNLFLTSDSSKLGIDLGIVYQNAALTHYQVYNDNLHYLVSPYYHLKLNNKITFDVRVNIENIKDDLIYPERTYWSDEFRDHRGGFEIAKITYEDKNLYIKFGRDYFMPGIYLYENLLFSKYNYPYDQFKAGFKNKYFELSSYYLNLNSLSDGKMLYQRHLNGHRLSINLNWGYIAFNDIMLYGGQNRQIELALFNPLLLCYPYQKNKKHFESNSLMSLELYLNYNDYFFFSEFLLDDYQADNADSSDLEPTEWGMNVTFGIQNIINDLDWKINYTSAANRTFNAPDKDYEKYIYKNYPIGHFLGNNFWEIKTTLTYAYKNNLITDFSFFYNESGDEALYAPFNKDYMNYSVEEGYTESFPFGKLIKQSGFKITSFYSLTKNILLTGNLSYLLNNCRLKNNFNFSLGTACHY